jgi:hypothetical protein
MQPEKYWKEQISLDKLISKWGLGKHYKNNRNCYIDVFDSLRSHDEKYEKVGPQYYWLGWA